MRPRLRVPALLSLWLALVWLGIGSPLQAEGTRVYDLPAGPAEQTLRRFATQSGVDLLFSSRAVRMVRTNALSGELPLDAALDRLLAGTGLAVDRQGPGGVLRVWREPPPEPSWVAGRPAREPPSGTPGAEDVSSLIRLSPFEVQSARDHGYAATHTLAGTRLATELRDTPAAISVFTREFLDDIGATSVAQALEYAVNSGFNQTDATGNQLTSNDLLVQFRGFTGVSLARNYFTSGLAPDSYLLERVDFSRGPNAILFGIAGPGGLLNATTKRARFGPAFQQLRLRAGDESEVRAAWDVNGTVVANRLALRLNVLAHDRNDWREFVGSTRRSAALAGTWRGWRGGEVRFEAEYGDVDQVVAQPWPAQERFLGWVAEGRPLSVAYGDAVPGTSAVTSHQFVYDPDSGLGPVSWFGSRLANSGPTAPSLGNNTAALLDESLLPRSSTLSGPGFRGDHTFRNFAVFVEQQLGPLALELALSRQVERREQFRPQVFNDIALRYDVNAQLPDGRPNPGAGRPYTDGQLQVDLRDQTRDDVRLTASYLWLPAREELVGRHRFTALVSRRLNAARNDGLNEVNLTPDGSARYPADLTHPNNQIRRRTYLDLVQDDPAGRGLHDPRRYPISAPGVVSGLARTRDSATDDLTRVDSAMAAVQSRFLDRRLVITAGVRRDRQLAWGSTADLDGDGDVNDDRDPVDRTFPRRRRQAVAAVASGDTRSFGGVWHARPWLSLFYNNADNFVPQSDRDIDGRWLGHRRGAGEDVGARVVLLDGRLSGSLGFYRTDELNTSIGRDNAFINGINSIWQTLGQPERFAEIGSRDTQTTRGRGWEFEITGNPHPRWRFTANVSRTEQVLADIQPRNGAYVARHRAEWESQAHLPLVAVSAGVPPLDPVSGEPSTIGTAIRLIDAVYAGYQQSDGQSRRQLRKYNGNVFTTYRLPLGPEWLGRITLGAGLQYRGPAVIGYDTTRENAPLLGSSFVLSNLMLAREGRILGRIPLRLQLNVDNLFNETDPVVIDADEQRVYRVLLQTPRRWSLGATFTF